MLDEVLRLARGKGQGGLGATGTMIRGIYRLSSRQFRKALSAAVFGEHRVELLAGIPFIMSENPPHILPCARVCSALMALAALPRWFVHESNRLELGHWLPLPDVVVLHGPDSVYGTRLAQAADVALVVEVADTSYRKDSGPKLRRYATYQIPVYWILDLKRRVLEVRCQPFGQGQQAGFARCDRYRETDLAPVILDGQEVGRILVADLLP
jgi:Uma2 family endonuclease